MNERDCGANKGCEFLRFGISMADNYALFCAESEEFSPSGNQMGLIVDLDDLCVSETMHIEPCKGCPGG